MTRVQIGVDDTSALPLYRWLTDDPDVRRDATLSFASGQPGDMGGALEVINVVLSNTIALSSLVLAIATWRGSRRNSPTVEIERDGVRVMINEDSPEAIQRVLKALSAQDS